DQLLVISRIRIEDSKLLFGLDGYSLGQRKAPIINIKTTYFNFITQNCLQRCLQKPFNARISQSAPALLLAPESAFELRPKSLKKLITVSSISVRTHKNEIADEIGCVQLGPMPIQCLKDDLCIVLIS